MREFSLHILDIVQNSAKASASSVIIEISEGAEDKLFSFAITDDGAGMNRDRLEFVRARVASAVKPEVDLGADGRGRGLGLWMLGQYCTRCGGHLEIISEAGAGTCIRASLPTDSPNRLPMGDIGATLRLLRHMHPAIEVTYITKGDNRALANI